MGAKPMASKVSRAMDKLHGLFLCEKKEKRMNTNSRNNGGGRS
jgi:hypothetical protein